jgi:phosphomannomutase
VPVHETKVGFKYLGPKMIATDGLIGGEESGGYAFRGHLPERDGVLAALYLLDFMVRTGKRPSELLAELYERVGPHYYERLDFRMPEAEKDAVEHRVRTARPESVGGSRVVSVDDEDGRRFMLENGGWLLLRFSGTEPLIRIYTEVPDRALVAPVLKAGLEIAGLTGEESAE